MQKEYYLAFSLAPLIGPRRLKDLLKVTKNIKNAWDADEKDFEKIGLRGESFAKFTDFKKNFDLKDYITRLNRKGVDFICIEDKHYSKLLSKIDSPPIVLFTKGNKKLLANNSIAVVGSRKTTSYGREITQIFVRDLALYGITVVSGLALGVDSIAHKTALENKGETIAVLGCGVDCCNPRENQGLYNLILKNNGLIISEYPLGIQPNKGSFPARNRIIAGISKSVLVTEAGEKSGSLITAAEAKKQNKKVFSVPGQITSLQSKGTLALLKHGAFLASSADDIVQELEFKKQKSKRKNATEDLKGLNLSREERRIFEILDGEKLSIDEISQSTKIAIGKLIMILSELEMRGFIVNSGGKFSLK